MTWLRLSAATMVATALVHSIAGERRLIGPILALNTGVVARPLGRLVLRFAGHLTSALMLLSAATVAWPEMPDALLRIIGAVWLAVGLFDAVFTRGRHIGWPALAAAGVFALLGSTA